MGYFANLYLVESDATKDSVTVETSVYGEGVGEKIYFSWGAGQRAGNVYAYAQDTLYSNTLLNLLDGYPLREIYRNPESFLLEAAFTPNHRDDPVLYHIVLPEHYVPRADREPLDQPGDPFVHVHQNRVVVTYPVIGSARVRFHVARLRENESLDDYDENKILKPIESRPVKIEFELNLGIFKVKFS